MDVLGMTKLRFADCPVGIENEEDVVVNGIRVFPNPSAGNVTIEFDEIVQDISAIVRNSLGEEVFASVIGSAKQFTLELSLSPELYFIDVSGSSLRTATIKVMIN